MRCVDLFIVGAGPAGMAAAITARRKGLDVIVADEQPTLGGQVWRSIELRQVDDAILGTAYTEGREVAEAFSLSGAEFLPSARVWQIEPGFDIYLSHSGNAQVVEAKAVLLATGAQERPVPILGWTLPGVMTVGAAQILLKSSGQVPTAPVWIAGSGPLPLLYAVQLLRAGGKIAGYLDTTPRGQWKAATRHLPKALRSMGEMAKGLGWIAALKRYHVPVFKGVTNIEAHGESRLRKIQYQRCDGSLVTEDAEVLLVHEGIVPSIHAPLSLACDVAWNDSQICYAPILDRWGESTQTNLFIAGDGAGIAGANAARLRGEISALRIAAKLGFGVEETIARESKRIHARLSRELAIRPFLDALYRPRNEILTPRGETIVCRCEGVTAKGIRRLAKACAPGPNQVKAASRAGMGPCQGRQCGYTVAHIIAEEQGLPMPDVGFFRIRPPLKPVSLGELASVGGEST